MHLKRGTTTLIIVGSVVVATGFMQLRSVTRTNPPVTGDIHAPAPIEATLRRACYDCHSNETHWPWYSTIAPASWIVARHVTMGRKEIDFSEWNSYYPATRRRKLRWINRALQEEVMPPWSYRIMHPQSKLTDQDRLALKRWVNAELMQ